MAECPGDAHCTHCGQKLFSHPANAIEHTLVFALTGLAFFIPANLYPLVDISSYGARNQNHLVSGPLDLIQGDMFFVGALVFLTSVVFPIALLLGLAFTTLCARFNWYPADFRLILRGMQKVYRWAMIDVYLLACLISFIKLADLVQVDPGLGLYCLGGALAATVLASLSFDPQLLWDRYAANVMKSA